ncbi:hypothetical protein FHR84_002289 [Actinopolyspora biskrensis]|uniref:Uncharacterized protein n=1 Tax=Actinopolyspora biskrensis TaxID=1470178 RepID=A0A852YUY4_9ACTN|nr:hypothetical protein [Actinopolyspora biskrensis]
MLRSAAEMYIAGKLIPDGLIEYAREADPGE